MRTSPAASSGRFRATTRSPRSKRRSWPARTSKAPVLQIPERLRALPQGIVVGILDPQEQVVGAGADRHKLRGFVHLRRKHRTARLIAIDCDDTHEPPYGMQQLGLFYDSSCCLLLLGFPTVDGHREAARAVVPDVEKPTALEGSSGPRTGKDAIRRPKGASERPNRPGQPAGRSRS